MSRITRRTFVRGAGVSLFLPLFHSLACDEKALAPAERVKKQQRALEYPKRFLVVYTPNGNLGPPPSFDDFTGSIFEPLTPFKDRLLMLSGLDYGFTTMGPGEPHQKGMAFLVGRPLNEGTFVGNDGSLAGWASGRSVDQEIANAISGTTVKKTLNLGVQPTLYGGVTVHNLLSYEGSDAPVSNDENPWQVFDSLFSSIGGDPVELAKLRARRKSVLDAVDKRYEGLIPKLSGTDKQKLEQHLTSIRDIESRLDMDPGNGNLPPGCTTPTLSDQIDLNDPVNFGTIGRLHIDVLVSALACDLTRVATLQWSGALNKRPYPFLDYEGSPLSGDDHNLGHALSDSASAAKIHIIRKWHAENFAYLLQKMDSIQEGEGTLLDHTIILWGSELAISDVHSQTDVPFLLAGKGAGFQMGRKLDFNGTVYSNNLLVALLQGMGIEANTFGTPEFCNRPLTELWG